MQIHASSAERMTGLSFGHVKQGGIQLINQGRGSRRTSFAKRFQLRAAEDGGLLFPLFESLLAVDGCCFSAWSASAMEEALCWGPAAALPRARDRGPG